MYTVGVTQLNISLTKIKGFFNGVILHEVFVTINLNKNFQDCLFLPNFRNTGPPPFQQKKWHISLFTAE
jgi:hypothetical protein